MSLIRSRPSLWTSALLAPSLALVSSAAGQSCVCLGDLDGNGAVNGADLAIVLGGWGACIDCEDCPADLTGDCAVDGADLAILLGGWGPCTAIPANDLCAQATVITSFTGSANPFCTLNAGTDGPAIANCSAPPFSGIEGDVWFRVTMPLTGVAQFGACADFDIRMAVYGPGPGGACACPSGVGALLGCSTTAEYPLCSTGTALLVEVVAGQCYTVRIGGAPGQRGSGNLDINFFLPPCTIESSTSLSASGLEASTQFGLQLDLSGEVAVAGAIFDDLFFGGTNAGSARVYRYDGVAWQPEQALTGPAPFASQRFGIDVGIDGNRIIVGAGDAEPGCLADPDCETGAAFVFEYDGKSWELVDELLPSAGTPEDSFGSRVAIDGTRALVAAWEDTNENGTLAGAVYVYERVLLFGAPFWFETAKLIPSDGAAFERFGSDVAVDGTRAIVGARLADAAYVFEDTPGGWIEVAKLEPPGAAGFGWFAHSVAISGDIAVIGAPEFSTSGGTGRAVVYERFDGFGWLPTAILTAFDAAPGDDFGNTVSIEGDQILVGARGDDDGRGSAHLFWKVNGGWVQRAKLIASSGVAGDSFGQGVAIGNGLALVGAYFDDVGLLVDRGSVFRFNGLFDCTGNAAPDACDIAGGLPDADGDGIPDECEP